MSSKAGKRLVPALRFPEFRDAVGWREVELAKVISLEYGNPLPESARAGGSFPVIGSNGIVGFHDFAITKGPAIIVGRKGSAAQVNWIDSDCFPIDTTFFVRNLVPENFLMRFIFLLLGSCNLEKLKDDGAVPGINRNSVYGLRPFSPNPPEQQKIADCLSSLDDLITAQAQKIEALKAHKKGLMQQLFPAEGETVPRLRFPEFRGTGAWEKKELGGKTLKVGSGVTPLGGEANYKTSGRPFVRSQNVGWGTFILDDIAFIDEETHKASISTEILLGDVLLNITGASIGRSAVADHRIQGGNVNQHVCIIRTKPKELSPQFLNQYLLSSFGQKQIDSFQAGGNRQGLNFAQIRSFSIPLPRCIEEQKTIAESLSSIDELVAAFTNKLEVLKAHKKGLMQGLFPAVVEGDA